MRTGIAVLLVMPGQRRLPILEQLENCGADVTVACDCAQVRSLLAAHPGTQAVLVDAALDGGGWREVIDAVLDSGAKAEVIVCASRLRRDVCEEMFARGATDLLIEPYATEDVEHALHSAASRSYMRSLGGRLPAARRAVAG